LPQLKVVVGDPAFVTVVKLPINFHLVYSNSHDILIVNLTEKYIFGVPQTKKIAVNINFTHYSYRFSQANKLIYKLESTTYQKVSVLNKQCDE
jgi:hypothetical protein